MADELYESTQPSENGKKPKSAPITRLSALDRVFAATGEVTIRRGKETMLLPIQSFDFESVEALIKDRRPAPKVRSELVNNVRRIVVNEADPEYQQATMVYYRLQMVVSVLCALAVDITDKQGTLVWSADNSVHEIDAAVRALKDMGIVDNQLSAIFKAAQELTQTVEEQSVSD